MNADFAAKIPLDAAGKMKTDLMVPVFIEHYLPHGVIGIIVVAIIAAAMSAYSSTLNSLSAVTMESFLNQKKDFSGSKYVLYSKLVALVWGCITMILAFFVGDIAKTVIEAINKIGSVFYGPILGIFLLAILTKKTHARAANISLIISILFNIYLWRFQPQLFWFWWNVIGCLMTIGLGVLLSRIVPAGQRPPAPDTEIGLAPISWNIPEAYILLGFFAFILIFTIYLPVILV